MVSYPPSETKKKSTCSHESCDKSPSFSPLGTKKPLRCSEHKFSGDINIKHRLCVSEACVQRARFGTPGGAPLRCSLHRTDLDVNLTVKKCVFPGCLTSASFHLPGEKQARRCFSHKVAGDVTTSREMCAETGCIRRPLFVNKESGKKHCRPHYDPSTDTGIIHLICQAASCTKHATFSSTKNKPLRCLKHRIDTDRDVVNQLCENDMCYKRPSFAPVGGKAKRCKTHSMEGDVNVVGKRCRVDGCDTIVDSKKKWCSSHTLV